MLTLKLAFTGIVVTFSVVFVTLYGRLGFKDRNDEVGRFVLILFCTFVWFNCKCVSVDTSVFSDSATWFDFKKFFLRFLQ